MWTKKRGVFDFVGTMRIDCIKPSLYKLTSNCSVDVFTTTFKMCVDPFSEEFLSLLMTFLVINFIIKIDKFILSKSGIEPLTRGFSVHCSTTELHRQYAFVLSLY